MRWFVHLSYNLVSGIIIICLPNQDSGLVRKKQFKYLLRIRAHLWVKRKPCRGYGCMLVVVALPMAWKFTLNTPSFLCVPRLPFLTMRLSFRLYPITRESNKVMTCGIFLDMWTNLNYSESFSLNVFEHRYVNLNFPHKSDYCSWLPFKCFWRLFMIVLLVAAVA